MKLRHDYKTSVKHLEAFGLSQITEAEECAANTPLLTCPFCGSEAHLLLQWIYTKNCVSLECSNLHSCGIRTRHFFIGYNQMTGETTSISEAIESAAGAWNQRAY